MSLLSMLQFALDVVPAPMMVVSGEGRVVLANAGAGELFGHAAGALAGLPVATLLPAAEGRGLGAVSRILNGRRRDGRDIPLAITLRRFEGDGERWLALTVSDLRDGQGQIQRMEQAMAAMDTAMILVDAQGRIAAVNPKTERLLGHGPGALIGLGVETLVPEPMRAVHASLRAGFQGGADPHRMADARPIAIIDRKKRPIPVRISLTPVELPDGPHVMARIVDLRESIAAERRFAEQNRALAERNRELTQFAYAVSHDLKAPLSSLEGLLDLIAEDLERGDLDAVRDQVRRSREICLRSRSKVGRILALACEQGAGRTDTVNLDRLLHDTWDMIRPGLGFAARLDLALEVEEFRSSETAIEVILHNLLTNALTHRDPHKSRAEVRVASRRDGQEIAISVSDNGIGIAPHDRRRMFEMFRRLGERGGHGIGLALVERQVQTLGGSVTLESAPGVGTTFHVRLPTAA